MTVALALLIGGYVAFALALAWRVAHAAPVPAGLADADLPRISVVVAARNEEACIGRCIDALLAQDYPPDRLEIVVVDDQSTDATASVVQTRTAQTFAFAGVHAHAPVEPEAANGTLSDGDGKATGSAAGDGAAQDATLGPVVRPPRVRLVRAPDASGKLCGKANALHAGILTTSSEIVLVTDADCAPPPGWARTKAASFSDPATGLVCGLARIDPRPEHAFDRAQALDWTLLIGAMSALAEAGLPTTGMGNNMGIRRDAYDAVGGYPALPFSVTEDFTLLRAVASKTRWRVRFPLVSAATVWTLPADGFAAAYRQRRRWARGGLTAGAPVVAAYAGLWLIHLLPLLLLPIAPLTVLGLVAAKVAAESTLLHTVLHRAGGRLRARDVAGLEMFMFAYLVTLPVALVVRPHIAWKGRTH